MLSLIHIFAGFIMNGTNLTNEFSQSPDFEIGTQKEAVENYLFPYKNTDEEQTDQNSPLFDESVVQKVIELPEIEESSLHITYGCYASYDYSEDYIQPVSYTHLKISLFLTTKFAGLQK